MNTFDMTDNVRAFARFLDASLPMVTELARMANTEFFVGDWAQANWERLVEAALPDGYLAILCEGADLYPDSSRVSYPTAMPTHIVVVVPREGTELRDRATGATTSVSSDGLILGTFGNNYEWTPPFDAVRVEDPDMVVAMDDVRFLARPIREEEI